MEKILRRNKGIVIFYIAVLVFVIFQVNRVEQINSSSKENHDLSYIYEK